MNILPVTNQQPDQTQSFGAFRTTDPKVLEGLKELIGDFFPITDVVQKGDRFIDSRGLTHVGDFLTKKQIKTYSKNTDLYLTKGDIVALTMPSFDPQYQTTKFLDVMIAKAKVISKEAIDAVMPNVTHARVEANIEEGRAIRKLGLD